MFLMPIPVFGPMGSLALTLVLALAMVPTVPAAVQAETRPKTFDHAALDALLKAHVRRGQVDYSAIKARGLAQLDAYLARVASADLAKLPRNEKLAFYLNAYNALVLRAVSGRMPLKSVMKVPGFFDKKRYKVAGRSLTLNALENKVIRPRFREPRIHFALVCAAKSCPPLQARAFTGARVRRDLARLTSAFINSSLGVKVSGETVAVSQLFNWYAGDFKRPGSVAGYLAKYHTKHKDLLKRDGLTLTFQKYDWSLNGR